MSVFAGINQGLQDFARNQMAMFQLLRQLKLDEMNLRMHEQQMQALEFELEEKKEASQLRKEKQKSLGESFAELQAAEKEKVKEMSGYDLYSSDKTNIEAPKKVSLKDAIVRAKEKAAEKQNYPLLAELTALDNKITLEEANLQKVQAEVVKSTFATAREISKVNLQAANDFLYEVATRFGIPMDRAKMKSKFEDNINIIDTGTGYIIIEKPDGTFEIKPKISPKTVEEALVREGKISEAHRKNIERAAAGASVAASSRERIASDEQSMKALRLEFDKLHAELAPYFEKGRTILPDVLVRQKGNKTEVVSEKEAIKIRQQYARYKELQSIIGGIGEQHSKIKKSADTEQTKPNTDIQKYYNENKGKKINGRIVGESRVVNGQKQFWGGKYGWLE